MEVIFQTRRLQLKRGNTQVSLRGSADSPPGGPRGVPGGRTFRARRPWHRREGPERPGHRVLARGSDQGRGGAGAGSRPGGGGPRSHRAQTGATDGAFEGGGARPQSSSLTHSQRTQGSPGAPGAASPRPVGLTQTTLSPWLWKAPLRHLPV